MTAKKRFRRKQKKWKTWGGDERFIPYDVR